MKKLELLVVLIERLAAVHKELIMIISTIALSSFLLANILPSTLLGG
jgi:hypothetical protein